MTKRRKPHKRDAARKWENPVLRALEAANLKRWKALHFAMMDAYTDGSVQQDMACILADCIATPLMALEDGWTVEDGLDEVMHRALAVLTSIAEDGFRWRASEVPLLKDAVDIALDVTNAMPVRDIANAQAVARVVRQSAAARTNSASTSDSDKLS